MDEIITQDSTQTILRNDEHRITIPLNNPYIAAATSKNTRKAYQSDMRHFEAWGGKLPASTESVLIYLQTFAKELNPRTLSRRVTAIKNWHVYQNLPDPTVHPSVSKTIAGIIRTHGKPKDKAPPLLPEQLIKIITHLQEENSLRAHRDSAILQIAFFGAFRRSELVAIRYEHITWNEQGIDILIPHSKTDQTNDGQYCAIPYGNEQLCPINALKEWLVQSGIKTGTLFRQIRKNGEIEEDQITPLSINHILKKRAKESGVNGAENFSSHSLRRGLATSASRDGASLAAIMRQGRWKNVNTVMEYVEAAQRFEENAAINIIRKISL